MKNIYEKRRFAFTEKEVKAKCELGEGIDYTDSLCPNLLIHSNKDGLGSYKVALTYKGKYYQKVVGSIYRVSLDYARDICKNIQENKQEFLENLDSLGKRHLLYQDFKENGFYPRKKPEIKLDDEFLLGEIERLKAENELLNKKLKAIENIVLFNEVDNG